ncbi:MAG TPA: glycosyltransferase family 4 protein [Oculatellaceae cyanobacterium]
MATCEDVASVTANSNIERIDNAAGSARSLHVAMVVRSFSEKGGLELYAHRSIEGLLARGHKVTVVCEVSDTKLEHPNLVRLFFPKAPENVPKAQRITHHFNAASRFVAEHGPFDVIHSQHLPMRGADAVTFHNHSANRLMKVGQNWERLLSKAKMVYSNAYKIRYAQDEILCQSPVLLFPAAVTRDDFIATYKLNERHLPPSYVVAHPGANFPGPDSQTSSLQHKNDEPAPFTFLFVGKGFRKKGLDILFAACKILNRQGVRHRLLIAGLRAKPFDKLRLQLMGLTNTVQYLGFRNDMQNVYAQAQATILPSRIEPFGMAPVQGMIYGLVPIVSAVSGVSEVLTDGVDSLILKDHLSPVELASLMKSLASEPARIADMSASAKQTAAKLTWDRTVEDTLRGYELVLEKKVHT